jgi:hypothetical protein
MSEESFHFTTVCYVNSLTTNGVRAGTQNFTGCTFQVGTYPWREPTHVDSGPQPLPHMRRNR